MPPQQPNDNRENDEPWASPMPGEDNAWFDRFARYVALGPARSVLAVYNAERDQKARQSATKRDKARTVPELWREKAKAFQWKRRTAAFDAHERQRRLSTGNASDLERIRKLDELVDIMHVRLLSRLEYVEVDAKFIAEYRGVLDLLAKHTGGYAAQRVELSGKDGKAIQVESEETMRVVFYVPEVESLDPLGETPIGDGGDGGAAPTMGAEEAQ